MRVFLFGLVFFLFHLIAHSNESPKEHDHNEAVHATLVEVTKSAKDFKIPTDLWDLIIDGEKLESKPIEEAGHGKADSNQENKEVETKKVDSPIIVWMPLKISLSAQQEGIIKDKEVEISYGMGGGELDLKDFVVGDKGSFFIKFSPGEAKDSGQLQVYFFSLSRKRKIDSEIFGSGCNVYFDISKKWASENSKKGIKVNVTESRHVSVLGGHFIFVKKLDNKLYISQIKIYDSTKPEYFCRE